MACSRHRLALRWKRIYSPMKKLILAFFSLVTADATIVTGTIGTAVMGVYPSGTCSFQAISSFTSAGGYSIIGAPVAVAFNGGYLNVNLVPTDTATPTGQYYRMTCTVPSQKVQGQQVSQYTVGPQFLLIPTSSNPVTLPSVTVPSAPPAPSVMIIPPQIVATGLATGKYCLNVVSGNITGLSLCGGVSPSNSMTWNSITMNWNGVPMTWN